MSFYLFNKDVGEAVFGVGEINPLEAAHALLIEVKFEDIAANFIINLQ